MYNLQVTYTGNFIIRGAKKSAQVWGKNKNFGSQALNDQMEAVRAAKKGVISVTLAQYKQLAKMAFATVTNK